MDLITENIKEKLNKYMADLLDYSKGYTAIYFNLSKLSKKFKSDLQLKITLNMIQETTKYNEGRIFKFNNSDILFIIFSSNKELMSKVEFQVRYLFAEDQLAYLGHNKINPDFCKVYNLSLEMKEFQQIIEQNLALALPPEDLEDHANMDINSLEKEIRKINIKSYIRTQPIAIELDGHFKKIFAETFINFGSMVKSLKYDLTGKLPPKVSNELIFWILDQAMLKFLLDNKSKYFSSPISLNLCISTVCSEHFSKFLMKLTTADISKMLIEFQYSDIIYDFNAFQVARKILKDHQIKFCVDGLNNYTFLLFENDIVLADLVKMQWNADNAANLNNEENTKLVAKIRKIDPSKIILTRCDNEQAIKYGRVLGIKIFQGWHIDNLT